MKYVLSAAMLLLAGWGALAEEKNLESEIKRCASYDGSGDRLACFDFVSGRKEKPGNQNQEIEDEPMGSWRVSAKKSKIDGSLSRYASVQAISARKSQSDGPVIAALVVRCIEGKPSSFITFVDEKVAYKKVSVQYRIGDGIPTKAVWMAGDNQKSYGLFDTKDNSKFIKSLEGSKSFYIRGETDIYGATEAEFNIEGVGSVIALMHQGCKW